MVETDLVLGYRALLTLPDLRPRDSAPDVVERHFREWAAEVTGRPLGDTWDGRTRLEMGLSPHRTITIESAVADDERSETVRRLYRLTDDNARGVFQTDLYLLDDKSDRRQDPVVVFEGSMSAEDQEEAIEEFGSPRIVKALVDQVPVRADGLPVSSRPEFVRNDQVGELVEQLLAPGRTVPISVSPAPSSDSNDEWMRVIGHLTEGSVGMAQTYVVDWSALDSFNELLPRHLRVRAGSTRTYLPRVDVEDRSDGLRHRVMGPDALARGLVSKGGGHFGVKFYLRRTHRRGVRSSVLGQKMPRDLRRAVDLTLRKLGEQQREERVRKAKLRKAQERLAAPEPAPVPPAADVTASPALAEPVGVRPGEDKTGQKDRDPLSDRSTAQGMRSLFQRLKDFFSGRGKEVASEDDVLKEISAAHEDLLSTKDELGAVWSQYAEEVDQAEERAAKLEQARQFQAAEIEDLQLALATTQEELDDHRRTSEYYRKVLVETKQFDRLHPADQDDAWAPPSGIDNLVSMLYPGTAEASPVAQHVIYSGNGNELEAFDRRDNLGVWTRKAWECVEVLYDYALAKAERRFAGNLFNYLDSAEVEGRKISKHKYSHGESSTVDGNPRMRAERTFTVPSEVHASGRRYMEAHFKIWTGDTFAPRMHFFDDTDRTGKIYIGYIGKHRTNTMT